MAQKLHKLSALAVRRLGVPGYYGDGGGLYLQVSATGTKSWIFQYKVAHRRREMGLGSLLTVDLASARLKALENRQLLQEGKDPFEVRGLAHAAMALDRARQITFSAAAAAYIDAHRGTWKNPKHAKQWESTIATYAAPLIGELPVAAIDTDLVVQVLSPIWQNKTETATRLRGRIESILDWATVSGFRRGDNPARWRGHLDNLLANPNKVAPVKNRPALPWQDMGDFMTLLTRAKGISARALEFAILTACRSGEVRGAKWTEVDLQLKIWTIPAARMKAGKEHRVPLSSAAIQLLKSMSETETFIFPGSRKGSQLSDMSLTAVLRRMGRGDISVHGFRSTFRDWCAEATGNTFPREVCEHALAHSLPDRVEAAYQRGDMLEKRKVLMDAWSSFVTQE